MKLSAEQMRALGYRVVDMVVEHLETLPAQPVGHKAGPAELRARLREPMPEQPADLDGMFDQLQRDVFPNVMKVDHPRFFAFVPGPGNFAGAMADALASGFNIFEGSWFGGSGPAAVELTVIDWLRQMCGMPDSTEGLFVSGGSVANLTCLAVARSVKLGDDFAGGILYFSDQTHSSVERALRVLGFPARQVRKLASDSELRLPVDALREAVRVDREAGLRPFCVIANAGTTSTGAVDPLPELARFCRENELWLHADGAFGAAAAICERGKAALRGLELVDSLSLDPHKWLFQPFEIGCALVRDGRRLTDTFSIHPEYLQDIHRGEEEVNFCDRGIQLTRSFRALKLWMTLKVFGAARLREGVAHGFRMAELAEAELRRSGGWEIVTPAQMAIVTFRRVGGGDAVQQRIADRMVEEAFAVMSTTVIGGRTTLRLCTINPRTTEGDIVETVRRLGMVG